MPASVRRALGVQRRQAGAVLLHAVGERPVRDQLQPRGDEQPDLLRERARQDLGRGRGRGGDAVEGEGREGRGLEGRGCSVRGCVHAVVVGRESIHCCWRGRREGWLGEAAVETGGDVRDGVGEVGGGGLGGGRGGGGGRAGAAAAGGRG